MLSYFSHKILVISLTFTLLFPIGISFVHAFEEHHLENCGDVLQFHEHEHETNCSVYYYTPGNQNIEINEELSLLIQKIRGQEILSTTSIFIHSLNTSKQLRAPPIYS